MLIVYFSFCALDGSELRAKGYIIRSVRKPGIFSIKGESERQGGRACSFIAGCLLWWSTDPSSLSGLTHWPVFYVAEAVKCSNLRAIHYDTAVRVSPLSGGWGESHDN